jgi:hypothetical protein
MTTALLGWLAAAVKVSLKLVALLDCWTNDFMCAIPVSTINLTGLLGTPPTVTTTFPVVAPAGTVTMMFVGLQEFTVAPVPLNVTVLVPWLLPKFVPLIAIAAPG